MRLLQLGLLLALTSGFAAILIYITGVSNSYEKVSLSDDDLNALLSLRTGFQKCVEVPIQNPVYLMLGASFGSAAKGTGLKALEFALSICEFVDMYGFTVDPGYKEWTRYFSESRQGHTPLHGRAYYQMMECLGLIKIHSPMRANFNRKVRWLPRQATLTAARIASEKLLRRVRSGRNPLGACSVIGKQQGKSSTTRVLREAAMKHRKYVKGATMYPLEHSPAHSMLCAVPEV